MIKTPKFKALAAAAGACLTMAAVTPAHAFVYAVSHLDIDNLTLTFSNASQSASSFTFDLSNSAALNGAPVASGNSCNSFGTACGAAPVLDSGPAVAGSTVPAFTTPNNNYTFFTTDNTNSFSRADNVITTAQLVTGTPTNTEQIAESLLNVNGFARAGSLVQSNTSLTITINIGATTNLALNFLADPDQRSQIAGPAGSYLSQSDLNASFTLTRIGAGGGSVSWAPQGTLANDCTVAGLVGVACTEIADSEDLNFNTTTSINPSVSDNSFETAVVTNPYGISITNLTAGTYTIAFNANTSTSITRLVNVVPEPDSAALVGAALAGLALTTLRRGRKQS